MIKNKIRQILFILLTIPFACSPCEPPPPKSYLQKLPRELWTELMHYTLGADSFWDEAADSTRLEKATCFNAAAIELGNYNFRDIIVARMRKELANAHKELVDPYVPHAHFNYFSSITPTSIASEKYVHSPKNPKYFNELLPIKGVLLYCDSDLQWFKDFVISKQCGGTVRKHIFIAALQVRHEYLVNYLWNSVYYKKAKKDQLRNRSFLRLASSAAKHSGYDGIHDLLEAAHWKIKEKVKAAQVWYPG